jgi:epsilon-lactone hydrolase
MLSRMRYWTQRPDKLHQWAAGPRQPYAGLPPGRVRRKVDVTRRDLDGWPVYEISPKLPDSTALNGHLLCLHGGSYVFDLVPWSHWPMYAEFSVLFRRTVTVPIYPLAPEHTYRDVYSFLLSVYRRVLNDHDPESVVFLGDSAGGGLALGLCHAARDAGLPQPGHAVLLSPWLHAGFPDPGVTAVARVDPMLNLDFLRQAASYYAGGDPLEHQLVSPATGPLAGLPKVTVLTGTHDLLNPDARAFRRRAQAEGVDIGWYELDGGVHVWMWNPWNRLVGHDGRDAWAYITKILR